MSAARHRETAVRHEEAAAQHEEQYDPSATAIRVRGGRASDALSGQTVTNPTQEHHAEAEEHLEHAQQHREAAQELERFEAAECRDVPRQTRSTCPLLGNVSSVEDIDGGVRVHLAPGVPPSDALSTMRCHLAFARTHGRAGMPACPLYLRDVRVAEGPNGAIDLIATGEGATRELRERVRAHVDH